jgi:hypothetical protein
MVTVLLETLHCPRIPVAAAGKCVKKLLVIVVPETASAAT